MVLDVSDGTPRLRINMSLQMPVGFLTPLCPAPPDSAAIRMGSQAVPGASLRIQMLGGVTVISLSVKVCQPDGKPGSPWCFTGDPDVKVCHPYGKPGGPWWFP